ncbi:hypothetical protein BJX68DRAFT_263599 [Aspergillus pseudodeflectus]|uniref:Up-regulated in Daf-2 domain-containing protein n=1 Tax=Aspergillus pseudodeflectus TaxID=176178 RepID=A0ABR4KUY8_9EURO
MPDHRWAWVTIRNNTDQPIYGVTVAHKYSDVYKNGKAWDVIQPGSSKDKEFWVDYNTGFLTTGKDWWKITWVLGDGKTFAYSNPENFRGIFDLFDKALNAYVTTVTGLAKGLAGALQTGQFTDITKGIQEAAEGMLKALLDQDGTVGFKQHMLESEDEHEVTEIVINGDGTIDFKSKSGNSSTVYKSETVA